MEMPNSNYKNLASVVLQNGGTPSDSTITIPTSSASVFPATPFYATIMLTSVLANSSNSEIVYVTGSTTSGTNTIFSVTRAQRNTSAVSWNAGEAVLTHAIYREDVEAQSQGYYTAVLGSGTAFTITNNSAPTAPVLGNKIRVLFDTPITTASSITLAINGGTPYTIASVGATFATATTLNTSLTLSDNIVYDLVFTGNNWTLANASSLVGAQDVTANIPIIGSSTSLPDNLVFVRTANIQDGAVTADKVDFTTFTDLITQNETPLLLKATSKAGTVVINYLGADITHSPGSVLFTIPEGFRVSQQIWAPFASGSVHGNLSLLPNGNVVVNSVSTSSPARVCADIVYELI